MLNVVLSCRYVGFVELCSFVERKDRFPPRHTSNLELLVAILVPVFVAGWVIFAGYKTENKSHGGRSRKKS